MDEIVFLFRFLHLLVVWLLRLALDMEQLIILMEDPAIPTGVSRDSPDTTLDTMDMDMDMDSTSVKLMLSPAMAMDTLLFPTMDMAVLAMKPGALRVFLDTMDMESARGLLMLSPA